VPTVSVGRKGYTMAHDIRALEAIEGVLGLLVDPDRWALVMSGETTAGAVDVTWDVVHDLIFAVRTLRGKGNSRYEPRFAKYAEVARKTAEGIWRTLPLMTDKVIDELIAKGEKMTNGFNR